MSNPEEPTLEEVMNDSDGSMDSDGDDTYEPQGEAFEKESEDELSDSDSPAATDDEEETTELSHGDSTQIKDGDDSIKIYILRPANGKADTWDNVGFGVVSDPGQAHHRNIVTFEKKDDMYVLVDPKRESELVKKHWISKNPGKKTLPQSFWKNVAELQKNSSLNKKPHLSIKTIFFQCDSLSQVSKDEIVVVASDSAVKMALEHLKLRNEKRQKMKENKKKKSPETVDSPASAGEEVIAAAAPPPAASPKSKKESKKPKDTPKITVTEPEPAKSERKRKSIELDEGNKETKKRSIKLVIEYSDFEAARRDIVLFEKALLETE